MFTPHTETEVAEMLQVIGLSRLEDLFKLVPESCRYPKLDLPQGLTEMETRLELQFLSESNETAHDQACFLGAGAYNHYSPAAVDAIIRRGEFLTAYTPYQPEISQGTLQAIFEYQSLIALLTGMEVCNASHYDGATAIAEAAVMAYHTFRGKRSKIVISPALHPQYRETIKTYLQGYAGLSIVGDESDVDLHQHPSEMKSLIDDDTSLVIVQYPDFFGRVFELKEIIEATHAVGALIAVSVNPLSLGLLSPPGEMGADIVTGEGQSLGLPLSFGGPYLGIFATKKEYIHKVAGRLVGETVDKDGKRAYVLTLTAREQHIRRERATSNICTNQGLMALASTVYLSLLGRSGLKQVASLSYHKAHFAFDRISRISGYEVWSTAPFFNEFVIKCPKPVEDINFHLMDHGIIGGYDLGKTYPALEGHMLLACTEMTTRQEIDGLVNILTEVTHA
ncbi:MAG: aminomethyl-transferring glycine dehydrogenase subunit GcvPA [Anaerolineaceae bacterium]|nr:aminomethyl-transferring glycine dehydrogenase subunit GcvPA [Anaerolineaceae bacterium]